MKVFHDKENKQINFLDERFYQYAEGIYFPSVTTVLDIYPKGYGFIQWLKDMGNNADEVLKRAGESGTKIHNAIEAYLKGEQVSWGVDGKEMYDLEEWRQILRFKEFWETYKPELIHSEIQVVSLKHQLGGTIDIICRIGKTVYLIDVKSSNAIYKTHELQTAAYAMMYNAEYPDLYIDKTAIFHSKALTRGEDKKGKVIQGEGWKLVEPERHYTESFKVFQHIHAIYLEENPIVKPKNKIYPDSIQLISLTNKIQTNGIHKQ